MTSAEITILITVAIFFVGHLIIISRFMEGTKTQITEITRCLRAVEEDLKKLSEFNAQITILHDRMNQSQADRRAIWDALENTRNR